MRLDTLMLRGVLRFQDTLTVDLRDLPPGLIAITGPNGAGKTTLLESVPACLWRTFPSRRDRSLVDYASGRDAFLEVSFALDGRGTYRARVALDGVSRQSDAVIEQITPDGLRQVLTDGKVTSYDAWIRTHLPSVELVLASVFAAQNRAGSFVTADRKARKQLFAQLLGLEHYEAMAQTARTAMGLVDEQRTRARAMHDLLTRETGPDVTARLHAEANALQEALARLERDEVTLNDRWPALEAERESLARDVGRYEALTRRQAELHQEIQRADAAAADLARQRQRVDAETQQTVAAVEAQLAATLGTIAQKIGNNQGLLTDAQTIRQAVQDLEAVDAAVREASHQAEQMSEPLSETRAALDEARARRQTHQTTLQAIERTRADANVLSTVPCAGQGPYAACGFLQRAQRAQHDLAALEARLDPEAEAAVEALQGHLDEQQAAYQAALRLRARLTSQATAIRPLAARAERLAVAEARIAELDGARTLATTQAAHARETALALQGERHADLTAQGEQIAALRAQRERERAAAATEAAPLAAAVVRARDLEGALALCRQDRERLIADRARLDARQQALADQWAQYRARRREVEAIDAWAQTLDTEWLEWQLLAKAFGRDGLPVLEIDAAGPTVSAYCTDLLQACFGGRFSVELVTQEAKLSGKGTKETFDVRVYDNLRGGEPRDLADLSGGEQVIVDEAIKNAIACFANVRSALPMQTCWRDETTGALDPENALRYVAMLRRLQAIAGFQHVLFVTHNPEAAALADVQWVVDDGQVTTQFPPFRTAA